MLRDLQQEATEDLAKLITFLKKWLSIFWEPILTIIFLILVLCIFASGVAVLIHLFTLNLVLALNYFLIGIILVGAVILVSFLMGK